MSSIKVVVPISGGKDSQAALKLATSIYQPNEIIALFCDTQFEHPITYLHILNMIELYGVVNFEVITAGSVEEQCLKHGRIPGGGSRFCTKELKIVPTKKYLKALSDRLGHGVEVWYGMRSDESPDRRKRYENKVCDEVYHPHEVLSNYPQYLGKAGVRFRLCILDWSEDEVFDYLEGHHNPLYPYFDRVGCFPCLAQGDKGKERAFAYDEFGAHQRRRVIKIASAIGKNVFESKGGAERNADMQFSGCALHCGI